MKGAKVARGASEESPDADSANGSVARQHPQRSTAPRSPSPPQNTQRGGSSAYPARVHHGSDPDRSRSHSAIVDL